jgi:hypothetical protein
LTAVAKKHEKSRLYLSLSEVTAEMMDLKNLLELLGFECHVAERIQQANDQLTEKSFEPLKTCNAGIVVITETDCSAGITGNLILTPEIQMEIGAAYLLYDRRIILLRERGIDVPGYWKNITTFELNNSRFDWQQGLALTKILLTL